MLCELRLTQAAKKSILGFKTIKLLAPPTLYRTDCYDIEIDEDKALELDSRQLEKIPQQKQIHLHQIMAECDGKLEFITWSDLKRDISNGCYELVQKSALPGRLKGILDKLIAIRNSYDPGIDDHTHPEFNKQNKLRSEVWKLVPEKWSELFELLIKADMFTACMTDNAGNYLMEFEFKKTSGLNGNSLCLDMPADYCARYQNMDKIVKEMLINDPTGKSYRQHTRKEMQAIINHMGIYMDDIADKDCDSFDPLHVLEAARDVALDELNEENIVATVDKVFNVKNSMIGVFSEEFLKKYNYKRNDKENHREILDKSRCFNERISSDYSVEITIFGTYRHHSKGTTKDTILIKNTKTLIIGDPYYGFASKDWDRLLKDTDHFESIPVGCGIRLNTGGDGSFRTIVTVEKANTEEAETKDTVKS